MGKSLVFPNIYQQSNGGICSCGNVTFSVPVEKKLGLSSAPWLSPYHVMLSFTHLHCPGTEERKCCLRPNVASTTTFLQTLEISCPPIIQCLAVSICEDCWRAMLKEITAVWWWDSWFVLLGANTDFISSLWESNVIFCWGKWISGPIWQLWWDVASQSLFHVMLDIQEKTINNRVRHLQMILNSLHKLK